jgi:hypothetical protein
MNDTLESLHEAFSDYRRKHSKGAYPLALRRRAVSALAPAERMQLGARLGLTAEQIGRWEKAVQGTPRTCQEFFEVSTDMRPRPSDLRVEVELPGGAIIRVQGHVDLNVLRNLVAAVQSTGVKS